MGFGKRLKDLRTRAGLPRHELAELANVSPSYPGLIESGRRSDVGVGVAEKLATVLGSTLDHLIRGTDPAPSDAEIKAAITSARRRLGRGSVRHAR